MGFKLLISDKSHPAIGALELDTLVELSHSDNVLLFENLVIRLDWIQVEEPVLTILVMRLNGKVVKQIWMVMIVDPVLYFFFIGLSIFLKIIK